MTPGRRSLPRWLQQWWAWFTAIFAITFVSFWPSFFSAINNVETHIVIHGISAIAWMLLTIIQASLIKSGWRKHHRTVGYLSLTLAAILVLSGLWVIQTMLLGDSGTAEGIRLLAVKFFYIDFTALVLFCVFLWLAIRAARRRDIPLHLRLMACTAIIPLEAALERTYIYGTPNLVPNFDVALYASVITLIVVTTVLVVSEWWYGRSRWPFAALCAYFVIMLLTTDVIAQTEWFNSVAIRYANF
ncbi:MAG: DUF2306 domain-containing protein [Gammaproteobacteria bacterium]|nr:DUF2306 domain-containing protein [Gammaproteobacteria bacterium]MDH5302726.1 DUF2306 domain-containing protein [Gammaproteobacteria bacterium]MDH5321885.1 DUF2306 domain-containing protein [Gammaproteobacteria bacterium]